MVCTLDAHRNYFLLVSLAWWHEILFGVKMVFSHQKNPEQLNSGIRRKCLTG